MSDTEEPTSSNKRKHSTENEPEEEAENDWIGPLPTDAATNKKIKGIIKFKSLYTGPNSIQLIINYANFCSFGIREALSREHTEHRML